MVIGSRCNVADSIPLDEFLEFFACERCSIVCQPHFG